VYVVVVVLLIAGDQLPGIALFDVVGNVNVLPAQIGVTWVNVGVATWVTITVNVVVVAH
jgi:hypothetical protein